MLLRKQTALKILVNMTEYLRRLQLRKPVRPRAKKSSLSAMGRCN
jgi:hypothetical protein